MALAPLAGGAPDSIEILPGGLVNLNLRVTLEGRSSPVVLRVYLREPPASANEAALLARLHDVVPVPVVLHAGRIEVDGRGDQPFLVMSLLPGQRLADALSDADLDVAAVAGRDVGAALAQLHACRYDAIGFLDDRLRVAEPMPGLRETWRGYLGEMLSGRAGIRLGAERVARLVGAIRVHGERLEPLEGRFALLHADCKPTNMLVAGDGTLTGLVDWEFAWAGPPLFDLGQLLRWPQPEVFIAAWTEAYRSGGGELPDDWQTLAALLDLMNLVGFLDAEEDRPTRERDVLALIDATLGRLEHE